MIYCASKIVLFPLINPDSNCIRKGVADEELAKKEALRRQRKDSSKGRSWSRSTNSFSSDSASTISTNLSRSISPDVRHRADPRNSGGHGRRSIAPQRGTTSRTRRFSASSQMSYSNDFDDVGKVAPDRRRGKLLGGQAKYTSGYRPSDRKRSRSASSLSSYSDSSRERQKSSYIKDDDRNVRRRRSSISPDDRGRDRHYFRNHEDRRERSGSFSREKSMMARNRNSMTPSLNGAHQRHGDVGNGNRIGEQASRPSEISRHKENNHCPPTKTMSGQEIDDGRPLQRLRPLRERSLSPYSKRLALTQNIVSAG